MEHFPQSPADNGASNGANSNQATIVRYVFSAALSASVLLPTRARKESQDRDAEGKEVKQTLASGPLLSRSKSRSWTHPGGLGSRPELSGPYSGLQAQVPSE